MRPEREPCQLGWFAARIPLVESKLPAPRRAGLRATRCAPARTTCPEVGRACGLLPGPARRPGPARCPGPSCPNPHPTRCPGPARPGPRPARRPDRARPWLVLPGRRLVLPFLNRRAYWRLSARLQRAPSRDAYATSRRTSARHRFLQCSRFSHAGGDYADTLRQLRRQARRPVPGFSGPPGPPPWPIHRVDPAPSRRPLPRPTGA